MSEIPNIDDVDYGPRRNCGNRYRVFFIGWLVWMVLCVTAWVVVFTVALVLSTS